VKLLLSVGGGLLEPHTLPASPTTTRIHVLTLSNTLKTVKSCQSDRNTADDHTASDYPLAHPWRHVGQSIAESAQEPVLLTLRNLGCDATFRPI
jgi:hypothetical protein